MPDTSSENKERGRRSTRFDVEVPALLWPEGNPARTLRGRTQNISYTGLYIIGKFDQGLASEMEFEVELPPPFGGKSGCVLRGKARVVRREDRAGRQAGFAAEIQHFAIRPRHADGAWQERAAR